MKNIINEKIENKWTKIIILIVILELLSLIVSVIFSLFAGPEFISGNVALIPIKGVIISEKGKIFGEETTSSTTIIKFIEEADKNPNIEAIVLEINSPGGSAVASEEIATALKKTNKTTIAWIREIGTSGAYWIASSADKIVVNRMSITGSIGVIASYLQFSGLLNDYNVTYERLVAGQYKDIGSIFKQLNPQERKLFQEQLDKLHEYFINAVAQNRNLPPKEVEKLATGMFYLGEQAKNFGLVDIIGGKDEVKEIIEKELNITMELVEYKEERRLIDVLAELFSQQSFFVGKGIGSSLLDAQYSNKINIWT